MHEPIKPDPLLSLAGQRSQLEGRLQFCNQTVNIPESGSSASNTGSRALYLARSAGVGI